MNQENTADDSADYGTENLREPGMVELARWTAGGVTGDEHRITAHQNGDSWLVLKQKKVHKTWKVEESWHADHQPGRGVMDDFVPQQEMVDQ